MASRKQAASQSSKSTGGAKNVSREDAKFIREHEEGLSRTTQRAKWIQSPDEHEDRPGQSLATRKREVIEEWARQRGAKPATVASTKKVDHLGVLRLDFPDFGGQNLQEVSWDDWFRTFEGRDLVFLFQEHKATGEQSNFFQLDNPQREEG